MGHRTGTHAAGEIRFYRGLRVVLSIGRVSGGAKFREGLDQWLDAVVLRALFTVDERFADYASLQKCSWTLGRFSGLHRP